MKRIFLIAAGALAVIVLGLVITVGTNPAWIVNCFARPHNAQASAAELNPSPALEPTPVASSVYHQYGVTGPVKSVEKDSPSVAPLISGLFLYSIVVAIILLGIAFYFLPIICANTRNHRYSNSIFWINLLFGWTVLGWLAAMIWAVCEARIETNSLNHVPQLAQ